MNIKKLEDQFQKQIEQHGLTIEIISKALYSINEMAKYNETNKQNANELAKQCEKDDDCNYDEYDYKYNEFKRDFLREDANKYEQEERRLNEMKTNILQKLFNPNEIHIIHGDRYYYYYKVGEYSFYIPINGTNNYNCPNTVHDDFCTNGCEEDPLLTDKFCSMVYNCIMEDDSHSIEKRAA